MRTFRLVVDFDWVEQIQLPRLSEVELGLYTDFAAAAKRTGEASGDFGALPVSLALLGKFSRRSWLKHKVHVRLLSVHPRVERRVNPRRVGDERPAAEDERCDEQPLRVIAKKSGTAADAIGNAEAAIDAASSPGGKDSHRKDNSREIVHSRVSITGTRQCGDAEAKSSFPQPFKLSAASESRSRIRAKRFKTRQKTVYTAEIVLI